MSDKARKNRLVAYLRVSTDRQGASGLGLEAQEAAIARYALAAGCRVVAKFVEVETGRRNDRPELADALRRATAEGATLTIAKLDRLSRNARFLLTLVESGVDVVFCDLPSIPPGPVGKFLITQMAAVAELEAGLISERTKAALAARKARGGLLGANLVGCHLTREDRTKGAARGHETQSQATRKADGAVFPLLDGLRRSGLSFREVAERANETGYVTRTGRPWNAMQVRRVLGRRGNVGA